MECLLILLNFNEFSYIIDVCSYLKYCVSWPNFHILYVWLSHVRNVINDDFPKFYITIIQIVPLNIINYFGLLIIVWKYSKYLKAYHIRSQKNMLQFTVSMQHNFLIILHVSVCDILNLWTRNSYIESSFLHYYWLANRWKSTDKRNVFQFVTIFLKYIKRKNKHCTENIWKIYVSYVVLCCIFSLTLMEVGGYIVSYWFCRINLEKMGKNNKN